MCRLCKKNALHVKFEKRGRFNKKNHKTKMQGQGLANGPK